MIDLSTNVGASKPTQEEVNEVLSGLDQGGDGKISADEFQVLIE